MEQKYGEQGQGLNILCMDWLDHSTKDKILIARKNKVV
jgi:hypothetical protein